MASPPNDFTQTRLPSTSSFATIISAIPKRLKWNESKSIEPSDAPAKKTLPDASGTMDIP